jgi:hypothetical protein
MDFLWSVMSVGEKISFVCSLVNCLLVARKHFAARLLREMQSLCSRISADVFLYNQI